MAKQITARNQGDEYQARWFWLQACALLDHNSFVDRVCYEENNLKSIDDVVVYYRNGKTDKCGEPQKADFYQVKFHVTSNGAITAKALTEPQFIGAKTYSLLQRLLNAYRTFGNSIAGYRFSLYTPWIVHPDDPLAKVHSQDDGGFRLDKIQRGGPNSEMGKMRRLWIEHLDLDDEEELFRLLKTVRIQQGPTLERLGQDLNLRLAYVGLKPVPEDSLSHAYDELTRKMLAVDIRELDKTKLMDHCRREGLWVGAPVSQSNVKVLGIRTFVKYAEDLQNQTDALLCLAQHFEGRSIKGKQLWHSVIRHELEEFVSQQFTSGGDYLLHLDTHSSIAFSAGYLLPSKIGANFTIVQRTYSGLKKWHVGSETTNHEFTVLDMNDEHKNPNGDQMAVAIGITHDITDDVRDYVSHNLPKVRTILMAVPLNGASGMFIENGSHAAALARTIINKISAICKRMDTVIQIHIFAAAPNAFMFIFGRMAQNIPCWNLYEYDFGTKVKGAYSPSMVFPPIPIRSREKFAKEIVSQKET